MSEPNIAPDRLETFTGEGIAALLNLPVAKDSESWPEPESLGSELPAVPAFDPELLPESLRDWCIDIAERMQMPLDFPAVTAVAALGAATMRRAEIQPKASDTTWTEFPNLWGGLIAGPGLLKSPTVTAVMAPLRAIERKLLDDYKAQQQQAELDGQRQQLNNRVWEQQYIAAKKKEHEPPSKPGATISEPTQKRLLTSDGTFESLHQILSENPAGIAVLRDELTGWLSGLERQGRESERAFALEAWSGHSGFTIDRIGRGSIHVDHCCLSVFGGIQPARLRSYLADALKDGPSNDGLVQRFQLLVWPDTATSWNYIDRLPNGTAQRRAECVYQRLAEMDDEKPLRLKFDDVAQQMFVAWLTDLEKTIRDDDLPPVLRAHLAKYRKLMPALALLFSLADGCLESVSLRHARLAAGWCEYLEPHARRVYASKLTPEIAAARSFAKRLVNGWKRADGRFTARDVYRPQWSGLTTRDEARGALNILCGLDWLRTIRVRDETGRPSEIYQVNPRIWGVK